MGESINPIMATAKHRNQPKPLTPTALQIKKQTTSNNIDIKIPKGNLFIVKKKFIPIKMLTAKAKIAPNKLFLIRLTPPSFYKSPDLCYNQLDQKYPTRKVSSFTSKHNEV